MIGNNLLTVFDDLEVAQKRLAYSLGICVIDGKQITYEDFVTTLEKKFPKAEAHHQDNVTLVNINNEYASKLEVVHEALGIATEAGETADILKAHAVYGKPLDRAALVKELGDVSFWIQAIMARFRITHSEIIAGNVDKLTERYKKMVYTDTAAIDRVDKKIVVCDSANNFEKGNYLAGPFEHYYEAKNWCEESGLTNYNDYIYKLL